MTSGNFKKLLRNLRTGQNEAFIHIRNITFIPKGEKGKKGDIRSEKNSDPRKESHR